MNSFWPAAAAAGSGSLYGAKPCNLNVMPSTDLHANIPGRGVVNSVQDKGQGLAMFPGHTGKDKASQAANVVDSAQRKQILVQQALPPGAPSNILVCFTQICVFFFFFFLGWLGWILTFSGFLFFNISARPCYHLSFEPATGSCCCFC